MNILEKLLERFSSLSRALLPFRCLSYLTAAVLALVIVLSFLFTPSVESNHYTLPGLLGTIWCLLLAIMITAFQSVPCVDKDKSFFQRIKVRLTRLGYWVLALVFLILTLALVILTFRLMTIWFRL